MRVLLFLLCSFCSFATIPIIDNNRGFWVNRDSNYVVVSTPYILGITTPYPVNLDIRFDVRNLTLDYSRVSVYNGIALNYSDAQLYISGYTLAGIPVNGIKVSGCGYLDFYEGGVYQGSFIPEPSTLVLMSMGLIFVKGMYGKMGNKSR